MPYIFRALALSALLLTASACRDKSGSRTAFDGQAALGHVKTQLDFGPRIPGTEGHRRTGDWIVAELRMWPETAIVQERADHTEGG